MDRASDYGSEGWGFESLQAHRKHSPPGKQSISLADLFRGADGEGSKIYKMYRLLNQALRRVGLGLYLVLFPRDFVQDGLITSGLRIFERDDKFQRAKEKTILELGVVFEIDWRTHVFLWCLTSSAPLPGKAVELGTGNAWMFTMAKNHEDFSNLHGVHLIDRFSSFAVDKWSGEPIAGTCHDSYTDDPDEIGVAFSGKVI